MPQNLTDQINESLTNHSPTADEIGDIESIRTIGKSLGFQFNRYCPDSRERSIAVTKLEEAIMWAVKSIVLPRNKDGVR